MFLVIFLTSRTNWKKKKVNLDEKGPELVLRFAKECILQEQIKTEGESRLEHVMQVREIAFHAKTHSRKREKCVTYVRT